MTKRVVVHLEGQSFDIECVDVERIFTTTQQGQLDNSISEPKNDYRLIARPRIGPLLTRSMMNRQREGIQSWSTLTKGLKVYCCRFIIFPFTDLQSTPICHISLQTRLVLPLSRKVTGLYSRLKRTTKLCATCLHSRGKRLSLGVWSLADEYPGIVKDCCTKMTIRLPSCFLMTTSIWGKSTTKISRFVMPPWAASPLL